MALLREPLLLLARSGQIKKLVSTMPVSAGIVNGYVPGETTETPSRRRPGCIDDGLQVTLDHLGEDVTDAEQAEAGVTAYRTLLEALAARAWPGGRRSR